MGSLPNLHELCNKEQQPVCAAAAVPAPPRLSPNPDHRGGLLAGGGGRRGHHRRLQQTNSLCTGNFYGVIDRQIDMQINEVPIIIIHVICNPCDIISES